MTQLAEPTLGAAEGRARPSPSTGALWMWTGGLALGAILAFLLPFGITSTLLFLVWPGSVDASLRWDLALLNGTMGVLGIAAVLVTARLAFRTWLRVMPWQVLVVVGGIAIAIAEELVLHEWAEVHIGQYAFDYVAPTAFLSWVTVLVAVSGFATLAAPRRAAVAPLLTASIAAALVWLIMLLNAPGIVDGIEPESWGLAILIGLAALYALTVVALGIRRVARG